jgi:methyl-accepting chemotaxis protein
MARAGSIHLGSNNVEWAAVNQFTRETRTVALPELHAGDSWLGQNFSTNQPSAVVDEAKHLTLDFCTIFQRMNDAGDMLRVSTSVIANDGQPVANERAAWFPDGSQRRNFSRHYPETESAPRLIGRPCRPTTRIDSRCV